MDSEKRKVRNKAIIVAALCVAIALIVLFGLTLTKYRTNDLKGKVDYEPALFNTVLLGQLVDEDIENMDSSTYDVYVYKCNACESEEMKYEGMSGSGMDITICPTCGSSSITKTLYKQTLSGKKIRANLDLSQLTEFGIATRDNKMQVAPGSKEENYGYIYFTVTNGTTVQDVYKTLEESGTEKQEITPQVKNIAESDIRYTIHVLTANNLPLTYKLQDLDKEENGDFKTYDLKDTLEIETTEEIDGGEGKTATYIKKQSNSDYIVDMPKTENPEDTVTSDFIYGTRLLKCNHDGSLTVHRYRLKITWPSVTEITKTIKDSSGEIETTEVETVKNNDLSYMKELENIQLLLEVESYVNYFDATKNVDLSSDAVLVLNTDSVTTGLYRLVIPPTEEEAAAVEVPVYAKKIARFDAFDPITLEQAKERTGIAQEGGLFAHNYEYIMHIYNTDAVAATWTPDVPDQKTYIDPITGTSPTRENNGHTQKNGHYTYAPGTTYVGGEYDYHYVIALPATAKRMNASGINWTDPTLYKYYVVYNGTTYMGVLTNEVVQSETQTFDKETSQYEINPETQYQAMRFYDAEEKELALNFSDKQFQYEDIALYRSSSGAYERCKDDFRVFIDRTKKGTGEE